MFGPLLKGLCECLQQAGGVSIFGLSYALLQLDGGYI